MAKYRVAIAGASGFVGSALCERLFFSREYEIVPWIRSSGNAARVARLGVPLRSVDLLDLAQVRAGLEGCDALVNCSRGDGHSMVAGMKNLVEAARLARLRRFIHISSVAIYGDLPPQGAESEDLPPNPQGNGYGEAKLEQDHMTLRLQQQGVDSVILCPGNINGPYSSFLLHTVRGLADRKLVLVDGGQYPTNVIHVDNLVEAILCGLRADRGFGQRYFVNELERTTWREYLESVASMLNAPFQPLQLTREEALRILNPPKPKTTLAGSLKFLVSGEVRKALGVIPAFGKLNTWAYFRFQKLPAGVQHAIRKRLERPTIISNAAAGPDFSNPLNRFQTRTVYHSPQKLVQVLNYKPILDAAQREATYLAWLRFARLCGEDLNA